MGARLSFLLKQWDRIWSRRLTNPSGRRRVGRTIDSHSWRLAAEIERLEQRSLLSAANVLSTIYAEPTYELVNNGAHSQATPATSTVYSPSQILSAYGFNKVSQNGAGQTIAIVDAYNDPTIQTDLQTFDAKFGLAPPPSFTVVSQTGSTSALPPTDSTKGWEVEESLDVEWVHALAPGAKIVLVEANSASYSDLFTAVTTAANLPGVSVVSMSWGGSEFSTEASYDSIFTTPAGHQGVTFVASTGDNGAPGGYPAYSPNVLAVGGTSLTIDSSGNYVSESGWSGSGGGISSYESQPTYQKGVVTQTTTKRAIPDVSFDADPNTGVYVCDSFTYGTSSPWVQVGGTSFAAPAWGAIISIVDQARAQNGLGSLDGSSQTLPMLYQLDKSNPSAFHDITTGNNGYAAATGYDLVTGLGTPVVNVLVPAMSGTTTTPSSKLVFQQTPASGIAGKALGTLTVAVENQSGQVMSSDNSTVTISIASGPGSFASASTLTAKAVNGVATFSNLVLNTAGTYTLTDRDGSMSSGTSSTITINAAQAAKLAFQQVPTTGNVGKALSSATVAVEDQYGNIVTSDKSTISMSLSSGSFASGSTTTATAVSGIATFNNLIVSAAGTYTLSASDSSLTKATSTSIAVTAGLSAPQNLVLTAVNSTTVQLSWSSVSGTLGYRVYQVVSSQSYLLGTVSSSTTTVQITGLTAGSSASFKVEAYNSTSIADSSVVSISMPTAKLSPPSVTVTGVTSSSLQLTWTASTGTQGYRVYIMDGSTRTLLGTVPSNSTGCTITGLTRSTKYQFQVESYQGSTVQDSSWVTVTTLSNSIRTAVIPTNVFHSPFDWNSENNSEN